MMIMQMKRMLFVFFMLQLPVSGVLAVENLYTGEVAISNQSAEERSQVLPDALLQVLQKLSGQREISLSRELEEALADAERALLSFQYKSVNRSYPDGTPVQELRLRAHFMQAEVDRIVQRIGLHRWQQERPDIQLWVVIDDGQSRKLKPVEYDYAWRSVEDIAAMRGLPVSWPELDEEEAQLIDMRLVWGGFTDYLVERGAPGDGVAIIAARREGPLWSVRWNLANSEGNWSWRTSDQRLMFALAQGVHEMTDKLASTNTIAASEQGSWSIDISVGEINSAENYAACLGYLQGLSLVNTVDILGASPGRVEFRLTLNASADYLRDMFNRGVTILPASAGSTYDYEFLPQ